MSYKFNGSNRIEFNDSDYNITGNLTLALWVKWSVLSTRTLIDYGQGKNSVSSADNNTPYLLELSSGDKLRLAWQVGTGFSDDALSTTFSPAINVWTHIACTRNSGTDEVIFYVNGAQLGTPVSYGATGLGDRRSGAGPFARPLRRRSVGQPSSQHSSAEDSAPGSGGGGMTPILLIDEGGNAVKATVAEPSLFIGKAELDAQELPAHDEGVEAAAAYIIPVKEIPA
jgi:hypothetical protein